MKLRYGEFPTHHPFLLIVRPLVDWGFKFVGWLVVVATFRFAYEKTRNEILWYVSWTLNLLVFLFVSSFVEWITDFKPHRRRTISGAAIIEAVAVTAPSSDGSADDQRSARFAVIRSVFALALSAAISFVCIVGADIVVSKAIEAILSFNKASRG